MKKIIFGTAICSMLIVLGSCKKFLDEKPLSAVSLEQYFRSAQDITSSVAGVYAAFQQEMTGDGDNKSKISTYGGKYHYWGESRSDDFERNGYYSTLDVETTLNQLTSDNDMADWTGLYITIGRANTCIKYIPGVPKYDATVSPVTVNNSLAQCYAMRAMCYFYIVRLWGDAPIWLEPYEDQAENPEKPRESKDKILDEVILPDLQKAYELIQKNQTANVWYINEPAICAMLADVYMWKRDFPNAKAWMDKLFATKGPQGTVYGTTGATLEPQATWKKLFTAPNTTNENIWSINWDFTSNGCACIPVSIQLSNNHQKIDSVLHTTWKKNLVDTRVTKSMDTLQGNGHWDKVLKYYDPVTNGTKFPATADKMNVYLVMYRLGDIYLLYAEALNQLDKPGDAITFLNFIRKRAILASNYVPYTTADFATKEDLEDAILKERQYELLGEGKRWFDLIRTNHVEKVMDPILSLRQQKYGVPVVGFGTDTRRYLWPLSKDVLNANSLLTQNKPYN
ncbi:RagB/SusD family nutrient uptake outer membrane protein [Pedobacter sp. BS3]|uniref:RagB/SusD family nutrient uptake outer membrane protein n=1 Tax=Pedobacter sp. BS3 TaxID=2567937 RepID=UPI0011EF56C3|nr:RagB/SusD family nutrient uptake outer membrane protein [Pedobacter sp. BS3]TZF83093.1 RagB/SusD family nutrient uptake outer membrane protein [Pedobacter sp. BS3]